MKDSRQFNLHDAKSGAALACRVTPGAKKDAIEEVLDDGTISVSLTVSSDEVLENRALLELLARVLNVSPESMEVVASRGKKKLITIMNMTTGQVHEKVMNNLSAS